MTVADLAAHLSRTTDEKTRWKIFWEFLLDREQLERAFTALGDRLTRCRVGFYGSRTSSASSFRIGAGSPPMMAADAATLRSASRCCQSSMKPASPASCSKKAR
jgi:hypothetical protein